MKFALKSLIASALVTGAVASQAAVVAIDAASFVANAGQITFSEFAIGTLNPSYTASQYGGTGTAPSVSFGSFFMGQSLGVVGTDCAAGTAVTGCVGGTPTGTLALDINGGRGASILNDPQQTSSPVLGGNPLANGSIAMLFSTLQSGISFDGGFFNAIGSTRVTAYGLDGSVLGSITNTAEGLQNLLIGTSDGTSLIAGLLISLIAPEQAGFAIDNLRFGTINTNNNPPTSPPPTTNPPNQTPEPTSLALVGLALVGAGLARRRNKSA